MKRLSSFLQKEELDPDSVNHIDEAAMGNLYILHWFSKIGYVLFLVSVSAYVLFLATIISFCFSSSSNLCCYA